MNTGDWAAALLIAAFAVLAISTSVNAPGLYATRDIDERLRIISEHRKRWFVNQWLVAGFGVLTVVGFVALATTLRGTGSDWIPIVGAIAITTGTVSGMYFLYRQTVDPRGGYSGTYPVPENAAYVLWLVGTVLFGVAILQTDLPDWLGYLTVGAPIAYGLTFAVSRAGFMTPFLLAFLGLVVGIVYPGWVISILLGGR